MLISYSLLQSRFPHRHHVVVANDVVGFHRFVLLNTRDLFTHIRVRAFAMFIDAISKAARVATTKHR